MGTIIVLLVGIIIGGLGAIVYFSLTGSTLKWTFRR